MKRRCLLFTLLITSTVFSWDFSEKSIEVGLNFIHGFDKSVEIKEPQMIASGLAIGDINGDGRDDIFVVTGETKDSNGMNINPNKLYISQQDGSYFDQAELFNLSRDDIQSSGPLIIDINGDGKRDLIFGSVGSNSDFSVYLNQNNNSFQKVENTFPNIALFGISAADTDKDGDLDLLTSRWLLDTAHAYWLNDGRGTFADVTNTQINAKSYKNSFTPIFADINNNNWPDLLLTSDFSSSKYFINDTTGFMLQKDGANITDENGMGAAIGDYDNDGDLDWFVTSIYDADGFDEGNWGVTGNRLYNNNGQGVFLDVSMSAGVRNGYWGWGACFADFNNDMYLDIFHVNGFPSLNVGETDFIDDPSRLFINNKNGGFVEMSSELNLIDTDMGRSVLCFDNDRDGDMDILIGNNQGQSKFFQNNLDNGNNYIAIKLKQNSGNIDAIGAKIQLTVGDVTQLRQVIAGGSFASSTWSTQHFGLADNTIIDSILITWTDASTQLLTNVDVNQYLMIEKGMAISGRVRNNKTVEGVADIAIKIYSESGTFLKKTFTDSDGNYGFNNLNPGSYRLLSENSDYVNQAYPGKNCGIQFCDPMNAGLVTIGVESVNSIDFDLIPSDSFYPSLSGLWYNRQQSGHGLQIEIIKSDNKPVIYVSWYAHLNGKTIWLTGTGSLNKGSGLVDLYITSGTSFPPNFVANDVTKRLWGTLNFEFMDLDNANIQWQTHFEQFQSGSLAIERLTNLSKKQLSGNVIDSCQSGTYFNPDQSGHGIMLEILGELADSIIITWFTYDNNHQQFWLLAQGSVAGKDANLKVIYTLNSNFPPDFDSSELDVVQWGSIEISRIDDDNLIMSWKPNNNHAEYEAGSTELKRLTKIKGLDGVDCNQ